MSRLEALTIETIPQSLPKRFSSNTGFKALYYESYEKKKYK